MSPAGVVATVMQLVLAGLAIYWLFRARAGAALVQKAEEFGRDRVMELGLAMNREAKLHGEVVEAALARARLEAELENTKLQVQHAKDRVKFAEIELAQERDRDRGKSHRRFLEALAKDPPAQSQVMAALATVHEDTQLWRVLLDILRQNLAAEIDHTLEPGLSGDIVHYNRGRAAGLTDAMQSLLHLHQQAQATNRAAR
jgi:hypothetical protein